MTPTNLPKEGGVDINPYRGESCMMSCLSYFPTYDAGLRDSVLLEHLPEQRGTSSRSFLIQIFQQILAPPPTNRDSQQSELLTVFQILFSKYMSLRYLTIYFCNSFSSNLYAPLPLKYYTCIPSMIYGRTWVGIIIKIPKNYTYYIPPRFD